MKLNYILSDTTKGATTATLKKLASLAENDVFGSYILLVPETKSIIIERELLAISKRKSFANVLVYSFVRLLDRLGGVPPEKTLNKQACLILLRKIIYENYDKLKCYKKTAKTAGFAEKIYDTIAQIKSSDISASELKNAMDSSNKSLKAKLEDVLLLQSEYEKALGEDYLDDLDKLSLLSNFANESDLIKQSNVFVVGFDNITFKMQKVLKDIAKNANEITFSSVYFGADRKDKYIQQNELFKKFARIADELKIPYNPEVHKTWLAGDFKNIGAGLFNPEKPKCKSLGNLKIFETTSKKQEIDFVASTILKQVELGKRYRDFGVLALDLENDKDLICDCFDVYKIPYFVNLPEDAKEHVLVRFIVSAFEMAITHGSQEKVLEFMANPLFAAKDYSLDYFYILESGANYSDFLNDIDDGFFKAHEKYFENLDTLSNRNEKSLEKLACDIAKLKSILIELLSMLENSNKVKNYNLAIKFLLEKFDADNRLKSLSENQRQSGFLVKSEVTLQMLGKLERFLVQLDSFLGEAEMPIKEFLSILKTGISATKVNVAPVLVDCVIIQSDTDGFYDIQDMFIVGATEGKFPAKIQDSGIMLDSELEETKLLTGKTIEPSTKDINRRENFRAYEALLEPKRNLYISYPLKSVGGKNEMPSRIVTNLVSIFGKEIVQKSYDRPYFVNFDVLEMQFVKLVNKFQNKLANLADLNKMYGRLVGHESLVLKNYLEGLEQSNHNFVEDSLGELYFKGNKTSVSQLQTYFDCPYKFFITYGLKLKENKLAKLKAPDIGTIIHRFAELFSKDISKFKSLGEAEFKNETYKLVKECLSENGIVEKNNKALSAILMEECTRLGKYILFEQENSGFKISKNEYVFDGKNAVGLETNLSKNIKIEGKIDRIDECGDYVRVVDYKTGKEISVDLDTIYTGTKIQLPSYFGAIQGSGKQLAGVFYLPVHSEYSSSEEKNDAKYKMSGFILDDISVTKNMDFRMGEDYLKSSLVPLWIKVDKKTGEISYNGRQTVYSKTEFENINNYVKKLCSIATEEILEGYIEPSPLSLSDGDDEISLCKYCPAAGFCGLENGKFPFGRSLSGKVDTTSFDLGEE